MVGISDATELSYGDDHGCVLTESGKVRCWGYGDFAKLGNASFDDSPVPVAVASLANASDVSAGSTHSCAVLVSGTVKCWGSNNLGQLGNGTVDDSTTPVSVSGISNAVSVSAGGGHTCAVLSTGGARCWGIANKGELGDGNAANSLVPVAVSGIADATKIGAYPNRSCVLLDSGGVRCWGANYGGGAYSTVPVSVTGITNAVGVGAGGFNSCAVLATGQARCWGDGSYGQIGDGGPFADGLTPRVVAGGLCESAPDPGFSGVRDDAYYASAVAWLVGKAITTGTSPGRYSPNTNVTRAQMAVFLYRAFGEPNFQSPHSFTDIPAGAYYSVAVSWLVETGITSGTSSRTYSPNVTVTRAQMAVFLHRATGLIPAGQRRLRADDVTRAQTAVFLHRRGCGISVA